jgi:hypothetical protein
MPEQPLTLFLFPGLQGMRPATGNCQVFPMFAVTGGGRAIKQNSYFAVF